MHEETALRIAAIRCDGNISTILQSHLSIFTVLFILVQLSSKQDLTCLIIFQMLSHIRPSFYFKLLCESDVQTSSLSM